LPGIVNPITGLVGATNALGSVVNQISSAVNLLSAFGTTRILQNPRTTALNNQQSILNFTNNKVYFDVSLSNQNSMLTSTGQSLTPSFPLYSVQATPKTIPVGVVLALQPSIDLERREIMMHIRPTITRLDGDGVDDPGLQYMLRTQNSASSAISNKIPQTITREMDSMIKIRDGDVMVMGGFTDRSNSINENGVPGAKNVPILGWLFKSKAKLDTITETVILIKATIIDDGHDTVHPYDEKLYKDFVEDPRKLDM
jgi:general secretion pathway protein D